MNNLRNTLIVAMATLLLFACGKSGNHDHSTNDHPTSEEIHDHESMAMEASDVNATQAYIALKNALIETNADKAASSAKNLAEVFHSSELHEEAALADQIAESTDVEDQRATFKDLSEKIYVLASEQKIEFTTLYKQYCPMAFDNTGAYWLSDSEEILNPYFGDKMLKCGRVEETLAKK